MLTYIPPDTLAPSFHGPIMPSKAPPDNLPSQSSRQELEGRIKQLCEEVKDIKELRRSYKAAKSSAQELANEINDLKRAKEGIVMSTTKEEIRRLEKQYTEIFQKMNEQTETETKAHEITKDLLQSLNNITSTRLKEEQAVTLLSKLVTLKSASERVSQMLFGLSYPLNIVAISIELESLLLSIQPEPFYREFLHKYRKHLLTCTRTAIPSEVTIFKGPTTLYICYPQTDDTATTLHLAEGTVIHDVFEHVHREFPAVSKVLGQVLKDALATRTVEEEYSIQAVEMNNSIFENTEFYIKNISEWILDTLMKRVLYLSKNTHKLDTALQVGTATVSREYVTLERAMTLFKGVSSTRKDKAAVILEKALIKFFEFPFQTVPQATKPGYDDVQLAFLYFSDVNSFIAKHKQCVIIEQLVDIQEKLLSYCTTISATIDASTVEQMKTSPIVAKALLKEIHYDFLENIRMFVDCKMHTLLITEFLEKFYRNFISRCLPEDFGEGVIKELIGFVLDFSYGVDMAAVHSYGELKEHLSMIK